VRRRDLRAELLLAEQEARDKKRKAEGKPILDPEPVKPSITAGGEDDESNKRRKLLQEVINLDKDDSDDEEESAAATKTGESNPAADEQSRRVENGAVIHPSTDSYFGSLAAKKNRTLTTIKTKPRNFCENSRRLSVKGQKRRLARFAVEDLLGRSSPHLTSVQCSYRLELHLHNLPKNGQRKLRQVIRY
jgi:hypothetical protein